MDFLLIDSWKNDPRIQEKIKEFKAEEKGYEPEYVNILEFCKIKYDINVTDLGRLFNVERQTIYNYYKLYSYELADLILETICRVYSFKSIDHVIEKELSLFLEIENIGESKINEFRDRIKKSFNSIIANAKDIYSYYINNPITPVISSLLKNNDRRFFGTALEILDKINMNSTQFLAYLMDYKNYIAEQNNPKHKVYERIDSIINFDSRALPIYYADFEPIDKVHLIYSEEVNNAKEFKFHVPEKLNINDLIVNITSSATMTFIDIQGILSSIRNVVGNDLQLIYGHITENNREKILIDVFAHEK